jgi:hypothetical protein
MTVAIFLRSATACALIAGSALMFEATAQTGPNTGNGQSPSSTRDRGANAPDPSRGQNGVPKGSDIGSGQSGQGTGQDTAEPGSSPSGGRGGAIDVPNCATMPPNAAECQQQPNR